MYLRTGRDSKISHMVISTTLQSFRVERYGLCLSIHFESDNRSGKRCSLKQFGDIGLDIETLPFEGCGLQPKSI